MYISKVIFDDPRIISLPYKLHQNLYKIFKPGNPKFIHRAIEDKNHVILISSEAPMSTEGIRVQTKNYDPKISDGGSLALDVKMSRVKRSKNGERTIKGNDEIISNIVNKFSGACVLSDISIIDVGYNIAAPRKKEIGIAYTHFTANAKILDSARMRENLFFGIGRKKAFGLGLIMPRKIG